MYMNTFLQLNKLQTSQQKSCKSSKKGCSALFGISGDLLELIKNLLSNKFQRVVLNGQTFEWEKNNAGVP